MADLLLRDVDERLVRALNKRAGAHGRSAADEHREILAGVLGWSDDTSFVHALAEMPDVGLDGDFDRWEAK